MGIFFVVIISDTKLETEMESVGENINQIEHIVML